MYSLPSIVLGKTPLASAPRRKTPSRRLARVLGNGTLLMAAAQAGCSASEVGGEESVATSTSALATETVSIPLPPGVSRDQVALGLTAAGRLAINDRAIVRSGKGFMNSTQPGHYAVFKPSASQMSAPLDGGSTIIGAASADEVTSVPSVLVRSSGMATSIRTAGTVEFQAPQFMSAALAQQNVTSLTETHYETFSVTLQDSSTTEVILQPDQPPAGLDPRGYGRVVVNRGSTLKLKAGAYRFASLILEPGSMLQIDNHAGTSHIVVDNEFIVRGRIAPSAPQRTNLLFYYRGQGTPAIDSDFTGVLLAPNGTIMLPSKKTHTGAFFARSIELHQEGVVNHVPYAPDAAAACGTLNAACCAHDWCAAGARCDEGTCRQDRCGWSGEACCPGRTCSGGLTCAPAGSTSQKPNTCGGTVGSGYANMMQILTMNESIYVDPTITEDPSRDLDKDWLKDDLENRLAEAVKPYFIFDEQENDISANINDFSLLTWEPRIIYQVHPLCSTDACSDSAKRIRIKFVFLFGLDGGFRSYPFADDWHYGDTQPGTIDLASHNDGKVFEPVSLNLWSGPARYYLNPEIETAEGYTSFGSARHPVIYMSAGKHHQYMTGSLCENETKDDCGGGYGYDLGGPGQGTGPRYADLRPQDGWSSWSGYTNVGERANYQPSFLNDLGTIGYKDEEVWRDRWFCSSTGGPGSVAASLATGLPIIFGESAYCFTGGTGASWGCDGKGCTIPTPVSQVMETGLWPKTPY